MMWLYLSLELVYVSLLLLSCTLLSVQLCIRAWFPSTQRWGQLLNAFAAVFTVLGGEALDVIVCNGTWIPISGSTNWSGERDVRVWAQRQPEYLTPAL